MAHRGIYLEPSVQIGRVLINSFCKPLGESASVRMRPNRCDAARNVAKGQTQTFAPPFDHLVGGRFSLLGPRGIMIFR